MQNKGVVLVVEGTDGSGKSFIIDNITPHLENVTGKSVVYNHLRPNWLPDIGVLLGKRTEEESKIVNSDPHSKKASGFIGSFLRWSYYMIDYTLGYFVNVFLKRSKINSVYIFDRYYYDYYIDQRRSRTSLPYWLLRFGELFVPSPDLILCLGGDPEKIFARKPETSLEEVTRQTNELRKFCVQRKNAVWVDTTLKPEESILLAKEAVGIAMNRKKIFFN